MTDRQTDRQTASSKHLRRPWAGAGTGAREEPSPRGGTPPFAYLLAPLLMGSEPPRLCYPPKVSQLLVFSSWSLPPACCPRGSANPLTCCTLPGLSLLTCQRKPTKVEGTCSPSDLNLQQAPSGLAAAPFHQPALGSAALPRASSTAPFRGTRHAPDLCNATLLAYQTQTRSLLGTGKVRSDSCFHK